MEKTLEQRRRAWRVMDNIEANPQHHSQASYLNTRRPEETAETVMSDCGTTACFAGWTVLLAGLTVRNGFMVTETDAVPDTAALLLGLDGAEWDELFNWRTDLTGVRVAVEKIFGPRPDGEL